MSPRQEAIVVFVVVLLLTALGIIVLRQQRLRDGDSTQRLRGRAEAASMVAGAPVRMRDSRDQAGRPATEPVVMTASQTGCPRPHGADLRTACGHHALWADAHGPDRVSRGPRVQSRWGRTQWEQSGACTRGQNSILNDACEASLGMSTPGGAGPNGCAA